MELTENLLEVLVGLTCDDETEGPGPPSMIEVSPLSIGLVVTVAEGTRRIDTTTPAICCTVSGDEPPVRDKVLGANKEMGGINNSDTTGAEFAVG